MHNFFSVSTNTVKLWPTNVTVQYIHIKRQTAASNQGVLRTKLRAHHLSESPETCFSCSKTLPAARRLRSTAQSSRTVSNSPATADLTISDTSSTPEKSNGSGSSTAAAAWSKSLSLSSRSAPTGSSPLSHVARPALVEANAATWEHTERHCRDDSVSLLSSSETLESAVSGFRVTVALALRRRTARGFSRKSFETLTLERTTMGVETLGSGEVEMGMASMEERRVGVFPLGRRKQ